MASGLIADDYGVPDRLCGGCRLTTESEDGGFVVAFGKALWHVECFKCAKCSNRVQVLAIAAIRLMIVEQANTDLLLLSDGSPVCNSCSYKCHTCKKPIRDEAVMADEKSYHLTCFNCRTCRRRIDDDVFTKTDAGISCLRCHNERVARSKPRAEGKDKFRGKARG